MVPGGLGTALKPGAEFWYLARKPFGKGMGVAANVLAHGTGGLNIGTCRIGTEGGTKAIDFDGPRGSGVYGKGEGSYRNAIEQLPSGRWPANVILSHHDECRPEGVRRVKSNTRDGQGKGEPSEWGTLNRPMSTARFPDGTETVEAWCCHPDCPVRMLDAQSGERKSNNGKDVWRTGIPQRAAYSDAGPADSQAYGDTGGASRFFLNVEPNVPLPIDTGEEARFWYCPKASRAERNAGLDGMPEQPSYMVANGSKTAGAANGVRYERHTVHQNVHPCVKPLSLMTWLVKLVTPPNGIVLDPFSGSGSTGVACVHEGVRFVGIEREAEYVEIARRRIAHAIEHAGDAPGKEKMRGGANATVSYGRMKVRRCNVCGTKGKAPGPGGRWPRCDHEDWAWVTQEEPKRIAADAPVQGGLFAEGVTS